MIKITIYTTISMLVLSPSYAGDFHAPILLKTGEGVIVTEYPGYAAPCWTDIDADGKMDLLVGQFNGGKIKIYKGLDGDKLATGEWLKAGGVTAKVPGVW